MVWFARPSRVVSQEHPEREPRPEREQEPAPGTAPASGAEAEPAAPETELERWRRQRSRRDALDRTLDRITPDSWSREDPDAAPPPEEDEDEEPPEPALHRWPQAALYVSAFALWAAIMTLVGEPWWEFEHGPLVSMITPVLAGRLVERLVLRRRPDWNRHEDADVVHERRRPELGERARPYWAREGADGGDGAGAPAADGPTGPRGTGDDQPGARAPAAEPGGPRDPAG